VAAELQLQRPGTDAALEQAVAATLTEHAYRPTDSPATAQGKRPARADREPPEPEA
jgi:hypothetical protein